MITIKLTNRQQDIVRLVRKEGPLTGEDIAARFNLTRATLRPDLAVLTMTGLIDARPRVGYYWSGGKGNVLGQQLETIAVREVKALPVVVEVNQSVYEAIVTMFLEDLGTLFVVTRDGRLEGVVTRQDLLKVTLGGGDVRGLPVGTAMTRFAQVVWLEEGDSVLEAINKLLDSQVDCLPIIKDSRSRVATGRFDREIALRLLRELAGDKYEEVISDE